MTIDLSNCQWIVYRYIIDVNANILIISRTSKNSMWIATFYFKNKIYCYKTSLSDNSLSNFAYSLF